MDNLWFEWEENAEEHFSFEDSDRFEEDSLCSWISEPESICANWRGWKRSSQNGGTGYDPDIFDERVESLIELSARTVARHIPFETVEQTYPQIPEQMQLRIAFWSFPPADDDIRLYSCLANGSPDEFQRGEHLVKNKAVKDALQIGFHLSATVNQLHNVCQTKGMFNVAVTFDRGRIISSNCTCDLSATWCAHVIALCLFRIHHPGLVCLRAPVSEYLSRLRRDQLQKFAQYLISELPQQILPTAQRLLDELLSTQESAINKVSGAPDPTAGPAADDQSKWCLDEKALHDSVRKMLIRFCGPLVFNDVNAMYLSNTAPPTAAEWSNLLRPLRGREPEGMWNLLYIVRELFHRGDTNAVNLLSILTEECLSNDQVVIWWFDSRSQASGASITRNHGNGYRSNTNAASTEATKHACAGFCDEVVVLWRLAALNPQMCNVERQEIKMQLEEWHSSAVAKARAGHGAGFTSALSCFPGFHPAIAACSLDWSNVDLGLSTERPSELNDNMQPISHSCGSGKMPHNSIRQALAFSSAANNTAETEEAHSEPLVEEEKQETLDDDRKNAALVPIPLQEIQEDLEVLCARAEALHVHGYTSEASKLAVRLAKKILSDETRLDTTMSTAKNVQRSNGAVSFTSTTLVKAAFLCGVLAEDPLCHHLAFKVGMFGLEMPRQPARSKALEVKLTNQESELVALLKKLPLGGEEMMVVREKADLICQGKLMRGEAVLPIMLATFIFEVLCTPSSKSSGSQEKKVDEDLGYRAAVCALAMKPSVLETHYPILCEGIRRQRGDLAIALLLHCKDCPSRLKKVKEVILDKSRYEGPSFVSEIDRLGTRAEEKKKNDVNSDAIPKMRGGFGVPPRRGSNGQSSSNTSDSGTDSSRGSSGDNRPRGRAAFGKSSPKVTITVNEVARDDESGSSSGVDTDSAVNGSLPRDDIAASGITVKVVEICQPRAWPGTASAQQSNSPGNIAARGRGASCSTGEEEAPSRRTRSSSRDNAPETRPRVTNNNIVEPRGWASREARGRSTKTILTEEEIHKRRARRTSDLDGSDIEIDIDETGSDTGGMSLTPEQRREQQGITARIVDAVQVLPHSSHNPKPGNRREFGAGNPGGRGTHKEDEDPIAGDMSGGSSSGDLASSNSSPGAGNIVSSTDLTSGNPPQGGIVYSSSSSGTVISCRPIRSNKGPVVPCGSHETQATASGKTGPPKEGKAGSDSLPDVSDSESAAQGAASTVVTPDAVLATSARVPLAPVAVAGAQAAVSQDAIQSPPTGGAAAPSAESGASVSADDTDGNNGRNRRQGGNNRGRRRKKGKKSAVNQATEAEAHFMFELAKTVLNKAGGASTSSVFSQSTNSTSHAGPHRGLQLCAFEIGLFAVGLHNRTSINWLSRTYSSHVSWISGQAMEIGSQAIQLLIERWETNLTPSEVASIADRASRSNDPIMVKAAADLALSCLHMAHMLNPGEIQRALTQCREQDSQHLDRACQAVESAARGGGVYPEVLFEVARHWYYLHEQSQVTSTRSHKEGTRSRGSQPARQQQQQPVPSPPVNMNLLQQMPLGGHPSYNPLPPPPYATPEQYVQQQMHQQVHQMMSHYQGQYPSGGYHSSSQGHYGFPYNTRPLHANQFQFSSAYGGLPPPYQAPTGPSVSQLSSRSLNQQTGGPVSYYLNNAYRVGMLALESLSRRTPDDRPNVKYSRSPPCSEDIRWLCTLSARLGTTYLHRFCVSSLNAVVSPYVLHDLALDAAKHLARSNPAQLAINLRSPNISPLVQKSLSMYVQCIRYHLVSIVQSEYDDFVEILRHARGAFCMVPGGMTQFNELLQSIRRGYPKKKDLWQMIMTGLAKA